METTDFRKNLQATFESITSNVYFQPTEKSKLSYPCILYKEYMPLLDFGNDKPYATKMGYQITVIDKVPGSDIVKQIVKTVPYTTWSDQFVTDNLYHTVLTVYTNY